MNSNLFSYSNITGIPIQISVIFQSYLEVNLIFEVTTGEEQKVSRKQDAFALRVDTIQRRFPFWGDEGGLLPELKDSLRFCKEKINQKEMKESFQDHMSICTENHDLKVHQTVNSLTLLLILLIENISLLMLEALFKK